ncbi:MAG: signal peptidase I [Zestosphaera tikiterensis]|uniref:Signal peptidase I n=1 Tax=Zestosphaera tikiterensis TaxID=1973259 RepID=A0A2R7Y168_9CREN|nr:MAG: signal peptidase I [Zestosphaera tikiterensis]
MAVAVLTLVLGRLVWFPVALFVVSGDSMLPTLKTGDFVLGVATYLSGYGVGDVVVWYATVAYGTIHRVVNVSEGYVVTKGDNNPLPDPSIPASFVKYKVVSHIPSEFWIPAVLALTAFYVFKKRREIASTLKTITPGEMRVAYAVFIFFVIVDIATVFLVGVQYFSPATVLIKPSVELRGMEVSKDGGSVYLTFTVENAEPLNVSLCEVTLLNATFPCLTHRLVGSVAVVEVPREVYSYAYRASNNYITYVSLRLNITFDKGWVEGRYSYTINWRALQVSVINNSVVINNPNYIQFNLTEVKVIYMGVKQPFNTPEVLKIEYLSDYVVGAGKSLTIDVMPVNGSRYAYVEFKYEFKFWPYGGGGVVLERRRVDFKG